MSEALDTGSLDHVSCTLGVLKTRYQHGAHIHLAAINFVVSFGKQSISRPDLRRESSPVARDTSPSWHRTMNGYCVTNNWLPAFFFPRFSYMYGTVLVALALATDAAHLTPANQPGAEAGSVRDPKPRHWGLTGVFGLFRILTASLV